MFLCNGMIQMIKVTLMWLLVSGPTAICNAFSTFAGREIIISRYEHSSPSLAVQRRNAVSSRTSLGSVADNNSVVSVSSRRSMIVSSVAMIIGVSQVATKANADVSDGNSLPEGAQQFARTIKLKTDLKDVTKRLLTVSDENPIDKKEWDNISKFLRTTYSTADNDMKSIAKGLSYNPPNQKQANNDVDEIKKYSQAGDISASKQDATRLASILTKISELLDDFFSSLSDVPDEI